MTGARVPTVAVTEHADGHRTYATSVPLGYDATRLTPAGPRLDSQLAGTRAVWWVDAADTRWLHVRPTPPAGWAAVDAAVLGSLAVAMGVRRVQVVRTVSSEIARAGR